MKLYVELLIEKICENMLSIGKQYADVEWGTLWNRVYAARIKLGKYISNMYKRIIFWRVGRNIR